MLGTIVIQPEIVLFKEVRVAEIDTLDILSTILGFLD